jgi:hypothetical protein
VEQQVQQSKEFSRLVEIIVLEDSYCFEWASPAFEIPKENEQYALLLISENSTYCCIYF